MTDGRYEDGEGAAHGVLGRSELVVRGAEETLDRYVKLIDAAVRESEHE